MKWISIVAITFLFALSAFADKERFEDADSKRFFVGCRPSFGECVYSCPNRRAFAEKDEKLCSREAELSPWACYCLLNEDSLAQN